MYKNNHGLTCVNGDAVHYSNKYIDRTQINDFMNDFNLDDFTFIALNHVKLHKSLYDNSMTLKHLVKIK